MHVRSGRIIDADKNVGPFQKPWRMTTILSL